MLICIDISLFGSFAVIKTRKVRKKFLDEINCCEFLWKQGFNLYLELSLILLNTNSWYGENWIKAEMNKQINEGEFEHINKQTWEFKLVRYGYHEENLSYGMRTGSQLCLGLICSK